MVRCCGHPFECKNTLKSVLYTWLTFLRCTISRLAIGVFIITQIRSAFTSWIWQHLSAPQLQSSITQPFVMCRSQNTAGKTCMCCTSFTFLCLLTGVNGIETSSLIKWKKWCLYIYFFFAAALVVLQFFKGLAAVRLLWHHFYDLHDVFE